MLLGARLKKGLLNTMTLSVAITLCCIFLALPQFNFGIWNQSEGGLAIMHLVSGVTALTLALLFLIDQKKTFVLKAPTIFLPLLLAVLTFVIMPFTEIYGQNLFGSPQIGEGLLWYLDLTIIAAASTILYRSKPHAIILSLLGISISWAVAYLTYCQQTGNVSWFYEHIIPLFPTADPTFPAPFFFPDYLAFFAIYTFSIAYGLSKRLHVPTGISIILAMFAAGPILIASDNKAAYVAVAFMALPAIVFLKFLSPKILTRFSLRTHGLAFTLLAAIGLTSAVIIVPIIVNAADVTLPGASTGTGLSRLVDTAESRRKLADIALKEVADNPLHGLTGNGWGMFTELLIRHLKAGEVNLRDDWSESGKTQKNWDAVMRVDFHSHNNLVQGFIATGIVGAFLIFLIYAGPLFSCRRRDILTVSAVTISMAGTAAMWFQVAYSLPFMALAWAALSGPTALPIKNESLKKLAIPLTSIAAITLIGLGAWSWYFANYAYYFEPRMNRPPSGQWDSTDCPTEFNDLARGGIHLAFRLRTFTFHAVNWSKKHGQLPEDKINALRGLSCAAEKYIEASPSFRLQSSYLLTLTDLAFAKPGSGLPEFFAELRPRWEKHLVSALETAPKRTDLAAPYLLWLLSTNQSADLSRLSDWLYEKNNQDPVGLWFSGIVLSATPDRSGEGISRMQAALEKGIEAIMPIDEEIKKALLE